VLAEHFSRIGVPVFMADVKGDLTGISQPGKLSETEDEGAAREPEDAGAGVGRLPGGASGMCGASRVTRCAPP
jgi:DNA helicase HerA-like ATPase